MNPFHLEWEQQDLDIFFTFYRKEQNFKSKMCTEAIEKQRSDVKHICYSHFVQIQGVQDCSHSCDVSLCGTIPGCRGSYVRAIMGKQVPATLQLQKEDTALPGQEQTPMPLLAVRSGIHVHAAANKAVPASYPLTRRHLFSLFIF